MKAGDTVLYYDPVAKARGESDTLHEWRITSIWSTNTESGDVACLTRPDETKKLGEDRCNASVFDLEKLQ